LIADRVARVGSSLGPRISRPNLIELGGDRLQRWRFTVGVYTGDHCKRFAGEPVGDIAKRLRWLRLALVAELHEKVRVDCQ
jgi:hypothetical protein